MALRISNYPDKLTSPYYAKLLASRPFWLLVPWSAVPLPSQSKPDEYGVGATQALDIQAPCWIFWDGTTDGVPKVKLVAAASEEMLERGDPPCPVCLPVLHGANVLEFVGEPEPAPQPPDEPAPEPPDEPQPEEPEEPVPTPPAPTQPRVITIYGGGIGNTNRPVVERRGDEFVASVPRAWFDALWAVVVEQIGEWFDGT